MYNSFKCFKIFRLSLVSSSLMICRYVSWVVVTLACPNLRDTLKTDTPWNNSSDACVCLRPCMEIVGMLACRHKVASLPLTVELNIFWSWLTKIGWSGSFSFVNFLFPKKLLLFIFFLTSLAINLAFFFVFIF